MRGFIGGVLGALAAFAFSSAAHATTITVNVTGGSTATRCSLTDAIQAAQTDRAVRGCSAGSSSSTDTIQLAANTTYQNYGKALYVPSSTGALVIQGTLTNGDIGTQILVSNYGYPANAGITEEACNAPAGLFVGGNVTVKNVAFEASVGGVTGICQYAGSLTLDTLTIEQFNQGAVRSYANMNNAHRNLTVRNTLIQNNSSPHFGGAIASFGDVTLSVTNSTLQLNVGEESAGALYVGPANGSAKIGNVTISGGVIAYNETYSMGGGIYLSGTDTAASVNIDGVLLQQNTSVFQGGGVCVDGTWGLNKVKISNGTSMVNNWSSSVPQQSNLNADSYNAVYCRTNSWVDVGGTDWTHTPPLKGDGTCTF